MNSPLLNRLLALPVTFAAAFCLSRAGRWFASASGKRLKFS
ncbi:hypothetical protein CLOSTMETH_01769 [[Clostridium] methylpentosum DSM 5476]|uniref:Uncharacterized protein n=1 Tax=[Clostridium] methylpentosum DSM 5476 TaxID=537013 RepID=C0ED43_9FIRM|nr:hypothetical protein CLOSTMETH_01769 [[Clostridium] methylpentosum DSM 5476]